VLEGVADLFYRDKLTGLYTRKAMDIIQLSRQYSVIALDIDHFKQVNDTWGHDAGDDILRGFGRIIKSCIRKGDYAIRWGGEEFVVIVSVADSAVVSSIAERIRATTENTHFHIHHGERQIRITCSAGIAIANSTHERSFSDVLKEADTKLYRAKQAGRNRVVLLDTDHALV
jgi:diguanylate cyclase (GGDEF)-like protein